MSQIELMWMSLESVTQSEERKRKTNIVYEHICMVCRKIKYIYETICRDEIETQVYKTDSLTQGGKERVGQIERVALTYIPYHV